MKSRTKMILCPASPGDARGAPRCLTSFPLRRVVPPRCCRVRRPRTETRAAQRYERTWQDCCCRLTVPPGPHLVGLSCWRQFCSDQSLPLVLPTRPEGMADTASLRRLPRRISTPGAPLRRRRCPSWWPRTPRHSQLRSRSPRLRRGRAPTPLRRCPAPLEFADTSVPGQWVPSLVAEGREHRNPGRPIGSPLPVPVSLTAGLAAASLDASSMLSHDGFCAVRHWNQPQPSLCSSLHAHR